MELAHRIEGLAIGQAFADDMRALLRVTAIDPVTRVVEAESPRGEVVIDDIGHFWATHSPLGD